MLLIPDGAELDHYFSFRSTPDPYTILFTVQWEAFEQELSGVYKNIFPELKKEFPELKLLVVGSNPPEDIRSLHNGEDIIVTGFVEDTLAGKSQVKYNPLGPGFREELLNLWY